MEHLYKDIIEGVIENLQAECWDFEVQDKDVEAGYLEIVFEDGKVIHIQLTEA